MSKKPNAATQREIVEQHLDDHGYITTWDAIRYYGITRLAEYIRQLRRAGKPITDRWQHENGKKWKVYHSKATTA